MSKHLAIVKNENMDPSCSPPKINIHVDFPIESYPSVELPTRPLDVVDSPKNNIDKFVTIIDQNENSTQRRSN
jgi:hypothetical protein